VAVVSETRAPVVPERTRTDPAGHVTTDAPHRARDSRRTAVVAAGLVLVVAGLLLTVPFLVLCGLLLAATSLVLRRLPADLAVPAAALLCLAAATVVGVAAGLAGVDLLARPVALAAVLVAVAGASLIESRRGPAPVRRAGPRLTLVAYVPAVLALGAAGVQAASTRAAASWAFYGTDLVQHMTLLKDVQLTGGLDYSVNGYPRGLHMLLALVSSPTMPHDDQVALLAYDLRLVAAADWLALALVLWTAAALALRLGASLGARPVLGVVAATVASTALLLTNSFVVAFVYFGAVPSLLALVALWAVPLTLLGLGRHGPVPLLPVLLVACSATAVLANLWQPLTIVPALTVVGAAAWRGRPAPRLPRTSRGRLMLALGVALPAAVALPPFVSVARAGGSSIASIPGGAPPVPTVVLALVIGSLGWLLHHRTDAAARAMLGASAGLLVMGGVLLHGTGKLDITQYYVMKSLWFLTVLLTPVIALAAVTLGSALARAGSRAIGRLGPAAKVGRVAAVAVVLAAFVAFVLPIEAVAGSDAWDSVADPTGRSESARAFDVASDYGTAYSPAVTVPVEVGSGEFANIFTTHIVSKIISFQTGQPNTDSAAFDVCGAIRSVAGTRPAVVVTTLDPDVLRPFMVADGCAGVPVVRVAGPHRVLQHVPTVGSESASRG